VGGERVEPPAGFILSCPLPESRVLEGSPRHAPQGRNDLKDGCAWQLPILFSHKNKEMHMESAVSNQRGHSILICWNVLSL